MNGLFWRALVAFLALPGTVAFAVPLLLIAPGDASWHPFALGLLVTGIGLLLWCVGCFYLAGRGTLAPWAPPLTLVVIGPYRASRNPMYVAVSLILWGWVAAYRSWALAIYACVVMIAFHVRVVVAEEPFLARRHGQGWRDYAMRVPRWLGIPVTRHR